MNGAIQKEATSYDRAIPPDSNTKQKKPAATTVYVDF
jgi:hypothetical protein